MRETLRFEGSVISATIFLVANKWCLNVELSQSPNKCESIDGVGVDH